MSVEGEDVEKEVFVVSMTAKEIKALARPEFAANPDKFYPTKLLAKLGFERSNCPICKNNYWRHSKKKTTCGDSQCEKSYSFIGVGTGIGRNKEGKEGKKITYAQAWEGFKKSLTTARVPCTAIPRYPVVARWRADVDYVAAGIFCFQPYCVTGELEPPANPLICPQFCLRFNDLDNIGLTGRHYSGFIMLGIQVFNKPDAYKFWHEECVEFNYRWLTEELGIDPDEITFIEDVWAGGGNLGPSIEYFVGGLELGNMVFMQFKTFPDGRREPLQVQVIDVGIGLERVPWLINGSATSYVDVFPSALKYLLSKVELNINTDIWQKYGPLSCLLNVDEVDDVEKTWSWIAEQIGMTPKAVKDAIEPIRDVYIVLDHTRTVLMAVYDGSLPSNVGGASNVRNILRRVFAILAKKGWWDKLGMDGFIEMFEQHKKDLATIYGDFQPYKSFRPIIELEFDRWRRTDDEQKAKLEKLIKKKGGKLDMNDWMTLITSWGMPADTIARLTNTEIPGNLYQVMAENAERSVRAVPPVLYSTAHLPPTVSLYYDNHLAYNFEGKIVAVIPNVLKNNALSVVVLDQSSFYPTSGGQEHDTGTMTIEGKVHQVVDVMKVGPCVLHVIEPPLSSDRKVDSFLNMKVSGQVNEERRVQLRNNHTATHIVYASCRNVLGPHVWQHGAKKNIHQAHLDITHYKSLTPEETLAIENEANRIVHRCKDIKKGFMPKDEAEKKYGFHLYQGGVVPGNELRVVNISDTDTEACCGTHCDNTAEVGTVKIIKTLRISDGILRLYYVAGENALKMINQETMILQNLTSEWGVPQDKIVKSAARFFDGFKQLSTVTTKQSLKIVELQIRCLLFDPEVTLALVYTDEENPTLFISNLPPYVEKLKAAKKGIVFVGSTFVYGLVGVPSAVDTKQIDELIKKSAAEHEAKSKETEAPKVVVEADSKQKAPTKQKSAPGLVVQTSLSVVAVGQAKKAKTKVTDIVEFKSFAVRDSRALSQLLLSQGFVEFK